MSLPSALRASVVYLEMTLSFVRHMKCVIMAVVFIGRKKRQSCKMISLDASTHESYYLFQRFFSCFFSQESGEHNSLL